MSQHLFVKKVSNENLSCEDGVLKETFGQVESHKIANCPWKEQYPYQPEVSFKIIHSADFIGLYYNVSEEFVKAQAIRANENVWEDSCVEFFVSLDNKESYYNFEFNVLGTGLIGYGPAVKSERNRLSVEQIDSIEVLTQLTKKQGKKTWEMYLIIPKSIITTSELSGKTFHANFYKCGDGLPNPHFISWANIDHPSPNFHLPQFFAELEFE